MDTYTIDINKWITVGQLFNRCFFIGQTIITQVAITIIVIPFTRD